MTCGLSQDRKLCIYLVIYSRHVFVLRDGGRKGGREGGEGRKGGKEGGKEGWREG